MKKNREFNPRIIMLQSFCLMMESRIRHGQVITPALHLSLKKEKEE
jgi:hypothetical protein